MVKRNVVIGMLGTVLDAGRQSRRWEKWRPTVAVCQHEDLLIDRFELLHPDSHKTLAHNLTADIHDISPETHVALHNVEFNDPWDFEEVFGTLHQFCRDYQFDTDRNDYLIHITTGTHVQQICLFLLTESRHLPGVLLQTSPPNRRASGQTTGTYRVIDLDLSRYDALAQRFAREREEGQEFLKSGIATRNASFNALIEQIEKVAIASKAPMLVTGPTGAGKSKLAGRIYELKHLRSQVSGQFVEVNCATLRGDQAMSSLFGHVKGAFTGATSVRPGLLKTANKGLLFLDEIGELGLDEQAMLLRAIEEKRFLPVGADREVSSDFQLIAGTNRDLATAVTEGRFREDLLARINLWTFELPGLSQRREDIEPNLDFELERWTRETGNKASLTREARDRFLKFAEAPDALWSSNFRDLSAAVTRMATLAGSNRIGLNEVQDEITRLRHQWSGSTQSDPAQRLKQLLNEDQLATIDLFDQLQLSAILETCRNARSISEAGRTLFAESRKARTSTNDSDRLRKYLARFGISWRAIHRDLK